MEIGSPDILCLRGALILLLSLCNTKEIFRTPNYYAHEMKIWIGYNQEIKRNGDILIHCAGDICSHGYAEPNPYNIYIAR